VLRKGSSSCSASDTHRVTILAHTLISREWAKGFTASNYPFYILKLVFIFSVLVLFHSVYSIIWHSELVIYDINYPSLSVCICFDSPRNLFIFVSFNVLLSIVSSLVLLCLFVLFLLAIVLSVLWFTDSDYPFGIFKLFLYVILSAIRFNVKCATIKNVGTPEG
jgi:hypothetical protein